MEALLGVRKKGGEVYGEMCLLSEKLCVLIFNINDEETSGYEASREGAKGNST